MNLFAERLRRTRISRRLSQTALAQACGLSQSTIANYENGSRKTAKDIFRLAEALGVNPIWLAQGAGPKEPVALSGETRLSYGVTESGPAQKLAAWPFVGVTPDEYWALPEQARAVVETTLTSLIKSLKKIG